MNNSTIEKSLTRAMNEAPSLDFNYIAHSSITKMTEHDYITRQLETKTKNYYRQFVAAISCCAVLLLIFTGWFFQYRMPDSIITLDVNPSIKIVTNRKEQVLSVKALNADAQKVLNNLDNKSRNLSNRVASIVTSIIQEGYIKDDKNVIMISIENKNSDKADTLVSSLKQIVKNSVLSQNITPLILKQTFQKDKDETALAEKHHISVGKLKMIQQIIHSNKTYSIDKLASISMEDLLAISKENGVNLQKIIQFDDSKDGSSSSTDINRNTSQSGNDQSQGSSKQTGIDRIGTDPYQSTDNEREDKSWQPENDQNDNNSSLSGHNQGENKSSHSSSNRSDYKSSQSENDQGEDDSSSKSRSKSNTTISEVDKNASVSDSRTVAHDSSSGDNNSLEDSSLSYSNKTDENLQSSEDHQVKTDSDVSKTDDSETNSSSDTQWEDGSSSSEQETD